MRSDRAEFAATVKETPGKQVIVWAEILEDAMEVVEGRANVGDRIQFTSYLNVNGVLVRKELPLWPLAHEANYYELLAIKPFDEIEMPARRRME